MKSAGKTEILPAQLQPKYVDVNELFMFNFNPFQWIVAAHVGKLCHWIFILCQWIFIQTCQKNTEKYEIEFIISKWPLIAQNSQN